MIDANGATWITLRSRINARIEELRGALETGGGDIERGGIAELRRIIGDVDFPLEHTPAVSMFPSRTKPIEEGQ